jgi:isopentenyl-diphosphate delta-isomerase type 1
LAAEARRAGGAAGGVAVIRALTFGAAAVILTAAGAVTLLNLATARRLDRSPVPARRPRVSVLVPARDEARHIGAALDALTRTSYAELEILVLDDGSSDATAEIAGERAAADPRVRLIRGEPTPPGWLGKPWACRQLAAAAAGEVLIFCDADVRAGEHAVRNTVATLDAAGAGVLTALPRQLTPHWWDAALVPLLTQLPVLWLLPLRLVERLRSPALAMGNGQWLAYTREAYDRAGGHAVARDRVLEDVALARTAKARGERLVVALAPRDLAVHMYATRAEMREGFRKNLHALLGGRTTGVVLAIPLWALGTVIPLAGPLLFGRAGWLLAGALAALRLAGSLALRHPLRSLLLHPVGAVMAPLAALDSARAARAGTATWKGRALPTEERVILVDEDDRELGTREKLDAHRRPALHRAFSVFVLNQRGELLLQRRAAGKYHSPGLWTNSACGHPRPGEATAAAARRRLREEMGLDCEMHPVGRFIYRAELGSGLTEHELDHVFVARCGGDPLPDPDEVGDWRWVTLAELRDWLRREPESFTAWFRPALAQVQAAEPLAGEVGAR